MRCLVEDDMDFSKTNYLISNVMRIFNCLSLSASVLRGAMMLTVAMMSVLGASAQLKVLKNGHVVIRELQLPATPPPGHGVLSSKLLPDSLAALTIDGSDPYTHSGGKISFGQAGGASIGERDDDVLELHGSKGISFWEYSRSKPTFFHQSPQGGTMVIAGQYPFTFNCSLKAESYLTVSDERMKSNIKSIEGCGDLLEHLTPVSYSLSGTVALPGPEDGLQRRCSESEDKVSALEEQSSGMVQYGFIAQEVMECYPEPT